MSRITDDELEDIARRYANYSDIMKLVSELRERRSVDRLLVNSRQTSSRSYHGRRRK